MEFMQQVSAADQPFTGLACNAGCFQSFAQ
jgi:hypothetical protein